MRTTRTFPCEPASARAARRFIESQLEGASAEVVDAVNLMVSELATNCIRHAQTDFVITVRRTRRRLRVEVRDRGTGTPTVRTVTADEVSGRGLHIVKSTADKWGMRSSPRTGNSVWFKVHLTPAPVEATTTVFAIPDEKSIGRRRR